MWRLAGGKLDDVGVLPQAMGDVAEFVGSSMELMKIAIEKTSTQASASCGFGFVRRVGSCMFLVGESSHTKPVDGVGERSQRGRSVAQHARLGSQGCVGQW